MNVIVIVTDSLRRDHLGCYGNEWIKTPHIDKFASEATIFDCAYPEGLPTLPVRTAWFTGKYTFLFRDWQRLEPTDVLLSEILWDKGYTSALITDTYHMHKPQMNYGRGFDYVKFIRGQEYDPCIVDENVKVDMNRFWKERNEGNWPKENLEQYLKNISQWNWEDDKNHFVAQVVRNGIDWLSSQRKKEHLFLWLDSFDPHEPWDPPISYVKMYDPDYRGKQIIDPVPGLVEGYLSEKELKHIKALYAGEVTMVDKWVGIFLDELKRLGFFENSLIIFISDHGEPFGEHGIIRKCRPWPYQELVRIPFILRHPEIGHGKRIDALVQTPDLMPTILDFLGIPTLDKLHGKSLLPLISGKEEKLRDYAYIGFYRRCWCIKNHKWSYMFWFKSKLYSDIWPPELYNLKNDPGERKNVIEDYPEIAEKLELELRKFVDFLQEKDKCSIYCHGEEIRSKEAKK